MHCEAVLRHDFRLLVWTPRVLAALMCVFLSLFALDAFSPDKTMLQGLRDFAWHGSIRRGFW